MDRETKDKIRKQIYDSLIDKKICKIEDDELVLIEHPDYEIQISIVYRMKA